MYCVFMSSRIPPLKYSALPTYLCKQTQLDNQCSIFVHGSQHNVTEHIKNIKIKHLDRESLSTFTKHSTLS